MIAIECAIEAEGWPESETLAALARTAIDAAAGASASGADGTVSLLFTDDAHIRVLNREWRGRDKATNVLSFPAPRVPHAGFGAAPLGDIVLARQTVAREAAAEGKTFEHHLTHLIVHGFLHLLGHDHEDETEAEEMEALERRALQTLAIGDPYA